MLQDMSSTLTAIGSFATYMQTPEDRTEDEYRKQIEDWEQNFRVAWPGAVKALAGHTLPSLAIQLTNRARTFFQDVQVTLHIEGSIMGVPYYGWSGRIYMTDLALPSPPRRWGPRSNSLYNHLLPSLPNYDYPASPPPPSRLSWRNTKSIDLTLDAGDVRPLAIEVFDEEEIVLYLTDPAINQIHGNWTITSRGFNEVFTGECVIPVGEPFDLTLKMNRILNPPDVGEEYQDGSDE
jgi:hypothetical protein